MSDDTTSKEDTQDKIEEEKEEEEFDPTVTLALRFNNEIVEIDSRHTGSYMLFEHNGPREYAVFRNSKEAGEAAREYWEDMARCNSDEFRAIVSDSVLIKWALGEPAGPGSHHVSSLAEWLDLWLDIPEEHFANYDGHEDECMVSLALATEMEWETSDLCAAVDEVEMNSLPLFASSKKPDVGWLRAVAYRSN